MTKIGRRRQSRQDIAKPRAVCRLAASLTFDFGQFGFGVGELCFHVFEFGGVVELFFRAGDFLAEILDSLLKSRDFFLDFFVHNSWVLSETSGPGHALRGARPGY